MRLAHRYECYKRYINSCGIKKSSPQIKDVLHIFFTKEMEIPFFDFNVNNACSLKCRNCDQGIPYLNNKEIYKYDDLKRWFDTLLDKVNYVYQISILGGEPFLNKDIDRIINYCANSKKIGSIIVVTNGTIIPSRKVIQSLKNKKIIVGISWYPINDDSNRKRLIKYLEIKGINYHVRRSNWLDFGDWRYSRNYSKKRLKDNYKRCFLNSCLQYNKGILYHCTRQRLLLDQKIDIPDKYEYIDVNGITRDMFKTNYKHFSSLESLRACNYCNSRNDLRSIPLGEQLC